MTLKKYKVGRISKGAREFQGKEFFMRCHRCEGAMIYQKFYGPQEHFWGWRCILCGDIIDQTILENSSEFRVSVPATRRWVRLPASKMR